MEGFLFIHMPFWPEDEKEIAAKLKILVNHAIEEQEREKERARQLPAEH